MRERMIARADPAGRGDRQAFQHRRHPFLLRQRGMFSHTGLSAEEVRIPRERLGVYLVESGRPCVAGLTRNNAARVAEAHVEIVSARG